MDNVRKKHYTIILVLCLCVCISFSHSETYWNQFRGPNGQGQMEGTNPPTKFDPKNATWSCELPPGHSSPVIWNHKIFLTAFHDNKKLETLCINRHDGNILWRQTAPAETIESFHHSNTPASSTPMVDQDRVYVYFGSYGLLCYDHNGQEQWTYPLPIPKAPIGQGSGISPIAYDGKVYLVYGSTDKTSFLLCVDSESGKKIWKIPRPFATMTYATPVIWKTGGTVYLVVASNGKLSFYDPDTGQEKWWITGLSSSVISVPVLGDQKVYCSTKTMGGFDNSYETEWSWTVILEKDQNHNGMIEIEEVKDGFLFPQRRYLPRENQGFGFLIKDVTHAFAGFDHNKDHVLTKEEWFKSTETFTQRNRAHICAVRPGTQGDCTETSIAWEYKRFIPEVPSLLFYQDRIYIVRDGGLVVCLEAKTGRELYHERVQARGQYLASPIAAHGNIYICSVRGTVTVLQAGGDFKVIETSDLGENIYATPALQGNTIYVRTARHLYAFEQR